MLLITRTAHHFAGRGHFEPLLNRRLCLHLGHFTLPYDHELQCKEHSSRTAGHATSGPDACITRALISGIAYFHKGEFVGRSYELNSL